MGELARALLARCAEEPAAPVLILPDGTSLSYGTLARTARACARPVQGLGIEAGQRVALVVGDNPGFPAWYAGVQLLGAVPCPVPTGMTPHETAAALRAVDPRCVLTDAPLCLDGQDRWPVLRVAPWQGDAGWRPTLPPLHAPLAPHSPGPPDTAAVHVTYRGMGRPLGVCHSAGAQRAAARAVRSWAGLTRGDIVLGVLPFARIFSFTVNLLAPLGAGAALILAQGPALTASPP